MAAQQEKRLQVVLTTPHLPKSLIYSLFSKMNIQVFILFYQLITEGEAQEDIFPDSSFCPWAGEGKKPRRKQPDPKVGLSCSTEGSHRSLSQHCPGLPKFLLGKLRPSLTPGSSRRSLAPLGFAHNPKPERGMGKEFPQRESIQGQLGGRGQR